MGTTYKSQSCEELLHGLEGRDYDSVEGEGALLLGYHVSPPPGVAWRALLDGLANARLRVIIDAKYEYLDEDLASSPVFEPCPFHSPIIVMPRSSVQTEVPEGWSIVFQKRIITGEQVHRIRRFGRVPYLEGYNQAMKVLGEARTIASADDIKEVVRETMRDALVAGAMADLSKPVGSKS